MQQYFPSFVADLSQNRSGRVAAPVHHSGHVALAA